MFPQFEEAYRRIYELLELYRGTGLAESAAMYGESGCGKTTVCKVIEGENPRIVEAERDVVPVLYTSIPALATINSVAEALLTKLGDPMPSKGTISSKTQRLIKLIHACCVDLVILDEFQHVHDRGQSPTISKVADWIKSLVDLIGRPVVLVGIPRAQVLVETNDQMRRRFGASLRLDRMTLDGNDAEVEFAELISGLADALPLQCDLDLQSYSTLTRFYYATDGRIGYLTSLLHRALTLAFLSEAQSIDEAILEAAFTEQIWRSGVGKLNPFDKSFCLRRLDKAGEPFAAAYQATHRRRPESPAGAAL